MPTRVVLFSAPPLKTQQDRAAAMGRTLAAGAAVKPLLQHLGLHGNENEIHWLTSEEEAGQTMAGYVALALGVELSDTFLRYGYEPSVAFDDITASETEEQAMRRVTLALSEWLDVPWTVSGAVPLKMLFLFAPAAVVERATKAMLKRGWPRDEQWRIEGEFTGGDVRVLYALT